MGGEAAMVAATRRLKSTVVVDYVISVTQEMQATTNLVQLESELSKVTPEIMTNKIYDNIALTSETFRVSVINIVDPVIEGLLTSTNQPGVSTTLDDNFSRSPGLAPMGFAVAVALVLPTLLIF